MGATAIATKYGEFRVVLDEPNPDPVLGFDAYASALTELIKESKPQFSVGIFGSWGSGKTSLMKAIKGRLAPAVDVVTVWFNPWRYEKEPHLIVPLLDTLREALVDWSANKPQAVKDRATKAASTVGRAARAILMGLTISAKTPVLEASLDPGKMMGAWDQAKIDDPTWAREPQSFYHASFVAMQGALKKFFKRDVTRVVVFVDDLDRCFPDKALEVLESMKLFFDLDGFVFVVGLDQSVIERAIAAKYQSAAAATTNGEQYISGAEYVKKVFQVPFGLPPIRPEQLSDYVTSIVSGAGMSPEQSLDLRQVVEPHLAFLAEKQTLNPREVKRFINAYTLQVKMLEPRLGTSLDPHAVLAVQALTFRYEWRDVYSQLVADPDAFIANCNAALQDGYWPGRRRTPMPPSFGRYVQGTGAVLLQKNLTEYIASVEATHYTDSSLVELSQAVRELWRAWGTTGDTVNAQAAAAAMQSAISVLGSNAEKQQGPFANTLRKVSQELSQETSVLPGLSDAGLEAWRERVAQRLEGLDADLAERRRTTSVGAAAA